MFVESRGGADSIKEKLKVDLPSNIFSCSVGKNVELDNGDDLADDTKMPAQRRSKRETSNDKVFDMVSRSNKEQIQMQQELAEENCKAQKEMADAHSRDMLLLTQQLLSSQEKWLLVSAIKLHKKELSA